MLHTEFTTNIIHTDNISSNITSNSPMIVLSYTYGTTIIKDIDYYECNCWIKVDNNVKMTVKRYITNIDSWYSILKRVRFFGIR
jgi:hypothetical protein